MATVNITKVGRPSAGIITVMYAVPLHKRAMVRVTTTSSESESKFTVFVAPAQAANNDSQLIADEYALDPNDSVSSPPIALDSLSEIRVMSDTGDVSFLVQGIEQDMV